MSEKTLTITDNRTGKSYTVPVEEGRTGTAAIRAGDLRQIRATEEDAGLVCYDPGLSNIASCKSQITSVDGEKGTLHHWGYPIEDLAENCTFLEVAYLLIYGELPDSKQLNEWISRISKEAWLHESIKKFLSGFRYDTHTMGMLVGVLGALSTFYPDAREIVCQRYFPGTPEVCDLRSMQVHIHRLIGHMPTIAAFGYRHSRGLPYVYPDQELSYTGNLLNMLFGQPDEPPDVNPDLERALEVLFILHADHEQNCSTTAMRCIGSTQADPYSCVAGAAAALSGPLHGGADEAVLQMLQQIGTPDRVKEYLDHVKAHEAPLPGFGHRLYGGRDPRVALIKRAAQQVFKITGPNPLMDVALEMEELASRDEFFVSQRLFPNTEFFSGIVYQSMGLPLDMIAVLFAIPRTAGWIANWKEMLLDEEHRLYRPRQVYTGVEPRAFVPLDQR